MRMAILKKADIPYLRLMFARIRPDDHDSTIDWLQEHLNIITEIQETTGKFSGISPIDILVDYWTTTGSITFEPKKEISGG